MAVHHATARKLATASEWALVEASFGRSITALTPARLRQKVARARKLQDKYRDLARQQRGEARGKRRARSTRAAQGNANTVVKQQMFAEALKRFTARLAQLEAKTAGDARPRTKPARSKARTRRPSKEQAGNPWLAYEAPSDTAERAHSAASRGARKQQKLTHQSALAHQGHVSARGRRNQGRRDGR